jgi:hypothetical protein
MALFLCIIYYYCCFMAYVISCSEPDLISSLYISTTLLSIKSQQMAGKVDRLSACLLPSLQATNCSV